VPLAIATMKFILSRLHGDSFSPFRLENALSSSNFMILVHRPKQNVCVQDLQAQTNTLHLKQFQSIVYILCTSIFVIEAIVGCNRGIQNQIKSNQIEPKKVKNRLN